MKLRAIRRCNSVVGVLAIASAILLRSEGSAFANQAPTNSAPSPTSTSPVSKPQNRSDIIDQVWSIVEREYLDSSFNGQNWQALRQQYLKRSYSSSEATYQAIRAMLGRLGDPFTRFISPQEFAVLQAGSSKAGIGLQIVEATTQQIVVVAPIEGSPAAIAGILPKDVLKRIDDQSLGGMNVYRAAGLIQGTPGTVVKVVVQRGDQEHQFNITRKQFDINPVRDRVEVTSNGKIGYIRLLQFSGSASSDVQTAIQTLEQQGVRGYLLDLRFNPGGSLDASLDIARMWLRDGTILSTVRRGGEAEQEKANQKVLTDKPLVILVDSGTANASEILAAALQDQHRAILVGKPTFGNNRIQALRQLPGGSGVAVTVAKWLPPSGKDIYQKGLQPDVKVDLTFEQQRTLMTDPGKVGTEADRQYARALEVLTQRLNRSKQK
ncbi:MAG: PDZ domain-containing protein [Myxacorys chilensis ATA2-1-KO14]|jgi:carboxyl-terminal processing protease|nr:PDZ domain-containing protein [Myxacorys chilensis ATA2-1-KO14]